MELLSVADIDVQQPDVHPASPPALTPGVVLEQRYQVMKCLGRGAMGEVYAAVHVGLRKKVALKVLRPELVAHPQMGSRFIREARIASGIVHPNIGAVTDSGKTPDGALFVVMEYIEGISLADSLERGDALTLTQALQMLRQICLGLGSIHAAGVVHRDLKPSNIMRVNDGTDVKLIDFGIAKLLQDSGGQHSTAAGVFVGTPSYAPPEQILGDGIDVRTDLYSLGVLAYRLLTGSLPFSADSVADLMKAHLNDKPKALPSHSSMGALSRPLRDLVASLLAKKREHRPASVAEVLAVLDAELATRVRPAPAIEVVRRPISRRPPSRRSASFSRPLVALASIGLVALGSVVAAAQLKPSVAQTPVEGEVAMAEAPSVVTKRIQPRDETVTAIKLAPVTLARPERVRRHKDSQVDLNTLQLDDAAAFNRLLATSPGAKP